MKSPFHIVIAGAGVIGQAMAVALAQPGLPARLQITLLDRQAPAKPAAGVGLRVSALSAGSLGFLQRLGIDATADNACAYRDMRVWDANGQAEGADALHFSAAEFAMPQLGYIVDDARLRYRLYEWLSQSDVELNFSGGIAALDSQPGAQCLVLEDGTELAADLLIGADGGASAVRQAAGIDVHGWTYAQSAFVTHAGCERPHCNTAWQRFLPGGPIALLPLADGRVSIVWSTSEENANLQRTAEAADVSAALTEASDGVLGALTVQAERASFPLRAQHAKNYVKRRLALIGDAAHTVHPLAGQGANLGLADAAMLAHVIRAAIGNGEVPGDLPVLRRYERNRRGANAGMLRVIDGLQRLFSNHSSLLGGLRTTGMRLFNQSGPLKQAAMRMALGLDTEPTG